MSSICLSRVCYSTLILSVQIRGKDLGHIDAVYDRGALEAINVEDRPLYSDIMKDALKGDFR